MRKKAKKKTKKKASVMLPGNVIKKLQAIADLAGVSLDDVINIAVASWIIRVGVIDE